VGGGAFVSEVTVIIRVTVNDAQVAKTNAKRARLGRQSRTGAEEIINRVGEALQHNFMFEQPVEITDVTVLGQTVGLEFFDYGGLQSPAAHMARAADNRTATENAQEQKANAGRVAAPSRSACMNDTNGDGNCGRRNCSVCYPYVNR